MNGRFPIGSVVRVKEALEMIIGYEVEEKDEAIRIDYTTVPYPAGIMRLDDLHLVNTEDAELVFEGYNEASFQAFDHFLDGVLRLTDRWTLSEIHEALKMNQNEIQEET